MICLLSIDPKHRRFTSAMLDFAFLMHSLSNKAYKQLRTVLPLPSRETIRLHFQDRIRSALAEALNLEQLPRCFYKYRRQIDYDGVIVSMMTPGVGMTLPVSPLEFTITVLRVLANRGQLPVADEESRFISATVVAWISHYLQHDDCRPCHWNQASTQGTAIHARLAGQ